MSLGPIHLRAALGVALCCLCFFGGPDAARAQGVDPENRPVVEIRIQGLVRVNEQLVRNQIRQQVGAPYRASLIEQDLVRITYLGRFSKVVPVVTEDGAGGVILTYRVTEQPLLRSVSVEGNRAIKAKELLALVQLRPGDPVDRFLIDQGKKRIVSAYENKGHFAAHVSVDQTQLDDEQALVFKIVEGPRVRIKGIEFQGNRALRSELLASRIRTQAYFPVFQKGDLDRRKLDQDVAGIRRLYQDEGYLDAEVGAQVQQSPNLKDAVVVFQIEEGPQYTVDQVRVNGAQIFTEQQVKDAIELQPGSVYSGPAMGRSAQAIRVMYGRLGFIETAVQIDPLFSDDRARVVLQIQIAEAGLAAPDAAPVAAQVGKVSVTGNPITRSKVILRQVRGMDPGRTFDREGIEQTEQRLNNNPLFAQAQVTVLGTADQEVRDVLIEVVEQNTGSISLGAGLSTDTGIIGAIDLSQSNFDITDLPDNWGELVTGQAFRGGGQNFALTLAPGNETSTYSVSWRDPYIFETDYFLGTRARFFSRDRTDYEEERLGAFVDVGRRLSDIWSASVAGRVDRVDITDIDTGAPVDVFAVAGQNLIIGLGLSVTRSTVDHRILPSRGSRWTFDIEQVGGDFVFTKIRTRYDKFWTLHEDFLGRKSILRFRGDLGIIPQTGESPTFERFYAGGHRTFRGFDFRGVGPRGVTAGGVTTTEAVGGNFMMLAGLEYGVPLVEKTIRGVVFTDQGSVETDLGIKTWRVSVGTGLRIKIPFLGQAPFAIDVAVPLIKADGDQTQFLSFDLSLPLN